MKGRGDVVVLILPKRIAVPSVTRTQNTGARLRSSNREADLWCQLARYIITQLHILLYEHLYYLQRVQWRERRLEITASNGRARARGAVFESQVGLAHELMKQGDTAFCGVDMCIGDIQVL